MSSNKNQLRFDRSKNTWVGRGSREINNNNAGLPLESSEISSLSSASTNSRNSSVNSVDSVNSNNTVNTSATLPNSASTSAESTFPPSPYPTSSSSCSGSSINNNFNNLPSNLYDIDSIYNNALDVDIDADKVYKLKKELKNTPLKYTTTKNKNKYGQDYDHYVPNLIEYRSRTTKKRGYDPQKHYTKTEAAAFHDRDDYNKVWDKFTDLEVEDQYQRGLAKRRKTREDWTKL
jgi:hypothetical protein